MNIFFGRLRAEGCRCLSVVLLLLMSHSMAGSLPLPRLVVVLLPGMRADDLGSPELPTLQRLIAEGGSGWMICRAARTSDRSLLRPDGRETTDSLLVTLGSGSRAVAPAKPPSTPAEFTAALKAVNAKLDHSVPLGALGDLCHHRGILTATIGDADSAWPDRNAWLLAADSAGRVDFPTVVAPLMPDDMAPGGVRPDVNAMLSLTRQRLERAGLVVVDCEALARADEYAALCLPPLTARHRGDARKCVDALLSGLALLCRPAGGSPATALLILSPGPAESSQEAQDRLAPLVFYADGSAGVLASPSTRRPGIVLNTDVLATIADRWQAPLPTGTTGRAFHTLPAPATAFRPAESPSALALIHQYHQLLRDSRLQNSPGGLPTVQLLLPLLGPVFFLLASRCKNTRTALCLSRLIASLACVTVTLPVGMLLLPLLNPVSSGQAAALLIVLGSVIGLLAFQRPGLAAPLFNGLCGLTTAALLLDLFTGTSLLQRAWMSYSAVEGARFYGIGNEYMGVAMGAALSLYGGGRTEKETAGNGGKALRDFRSLAFGLLFLVLTAVMGVFGAKVGAIPSAGLAFGVTGLVQWRRRLEGKGAGGLVLLALSGLGLLALFDARHAAGNQTHFIRALTGEGGGTLPDILRRKLALEGWLLLHSSWSATLLAAGGGLLWLRRSHPALFAGRRQAAAYAGIWAGTVASLLCNDSGLTAAALLLLYGWAWAAVRASET